ncbi:hypothetical protein CQ011_02965 [Arthrobacter sp. MYb213]|nr:hypothetical protein CQ011_02965 [Arthrobacter sp. MYb213]
MFTASYDFGYRRSGRFKKLPATIHDWSVPSLVAHTFCSSAALFSVTMFSVPSLKPNKLRGVLAALERQPSALLLGYLALCALSILCCFSIPLLGLASAFLLGSTLIGCYLSIYLVTPLLTG